MGASAAEVAAGEAGGQFDLLLRGEQHAGAGGAGEPDPLGGGERVPASLPDRVVALGAPDHDEGSKDDQGDRDVREVMEHAARSLADREG